MTARIAIILLIFTFLTADGSYSKLEPPPKFQLGDEVLLSKYVDDLKNKNVAVITNQTGILSDGSQIIDALLGNGINVVKIFSPEHGIRGDDASTSLSIDEKTGIPIVSLYGDKKKPSKQDLSGVDILIYDIQDVGARFYTYTSTLYYAIESAVENNKKILICDRPVIINPDYVDGFMMETPFGSFVGKIPTPVCYGMTCGELSNYLNGTLYSSSNVEVIKMDNYPRVAGFDNLGIKWVKPSPNIFYPSSAVCYPATCFLEGTNVSEGRGTDKPFEYTGAPWCNSELLSNELNSLNLNGVTFEPVTFTPSEKISSYPPKFFNQVCNGIHINVTDKNKFEPVKAGIAILVCLNKLFKEFKFNKDKYIDKLAGTDKLRKMVLNGDDYYSIINSWKEDIGKFKLERQKYLLYE
jgi:uncharacterized protein YbbC (DUF1343 family)